MNEDTLQIKLPRTGHLRKLLSTLGLSAGRTSLPDRELLALRRENDRLRRLVREYLWGVRPPTPGRRPGRGPAALLALMLGGIGCSSDAAEILGITDVPPEPPVALALLCDTSGGSTCHGDSAREVVSVMLRAIIERPSSMVTVWALGESFAETVPIVSIPVPEDRVDRWINEEAQRVVNGFGDVFNKRATRSPIAAGIAKVALDGNVDQIVIVSDAREYSSLGDFECDPPEDADEFLHELDELEIFSAVSLARVEVVFVRMGDGVVANDRCLAGPATAGRIREAWRTALSAHGSPRVRFFSGALPSSWLSKEVR